METGNSFLCLSLQEELSVNGKFVLLKLYNYSYHANCFLLFMCHVSTALSSSTGQLLKNSSHESADSNNRFLETALCDCRQRLRSFFQKATGLFSFSISLNCRNVFLQFQEWGSFSFCTHYPSSESLFTNTDQESYFCILNSQP